MFSSAGGQFFIRCPSFFFDFPFLGFPWVPVGVCLARPYRLQQWVWFSRLPPHTHCMFTFQVISSLAAPHLGNLLSSVVPVALTFPGLTSRRAASSISIATRGKFAIVSYPGGSSLPGLTSRRGVSEDKYCHTWEICYRQLFRWLFPSWIDFKTSCVWV